MEDLIFTIIKLVVVIIMAIITRYAIPFLKAEIGEAKINEITEWVDAFVQSAEMIFGSGTGEEKLQYVINQMKIKLDSVGVTITEDQLRALIESAVYTYCKERK